jgi:hypothetical protein
MTLQKTVKSPPGSHSEFIQRPILKIVVFGDHEGLVEKADNLSLDPPTSVDRGVLWLVNGTIPPDLVDEVPELAKVDTGQHKAAALSTKNKLADTISLNEPDDYVRIDEAFTKAGLPEYN